jgi:hypothetical protein
MGLDNQFTAFQNKIFKIQTNMLLQNIWDARNRMIDISSDSNNIKIN